MTCVILCIKQYSYLICIKYATAHLFRYTSMFVNANYMILKYVMYFFKLAFVLILIIKNRLKRRKCLKVGK